MRRTTLAAFTFFVLGFIVAQTVKFPQPQKGTVKVTVVRVVDGDTFEVQFPDKSKATVRVIGYDAPEKDQPFGETATKFLKAFLEGRQVSLEPDIQLTDRYGRRLYHVWIDNVLLSEVMLLVGLGMQMTIPPNVQHVEFLRQAQEAGRNIGLGIWSLTVSPQPKQAVTPVQPAVYYIGNARSKKFHRQDCAFAQQISPSNRVQFRSRDEAIRQGYQPCKVCNP